MKIFLVIAFSFLAAIADAQKIINYYDYNWKLCEAGNARFVSVVEQADTVWQRLDYYAREKQLQMRGFYKEKETRVKHGFFTFYHTDGKPSSLGLYKNDKKQGLWLYYHSNGMMQDSTWFENGVAVGTGLGWHANGVMSDSNVYNPDGTAVKVTWFDNGQLSSAGRTVNDKQNGKWQYFNRNGKLAAIEVYETGKLDSRVYFNEDGTAISDTTNRDREASSKKDWQRYIEDKLSFPSNLKIVNGDRATVLVNFTIDEEGQIMDAFVSSSFHPVIDKLALEVIRHAPRWKPAIDHNRPVKAYRRQPLTFMQQEN